MHSQHLPFREHGSYVQPHEAVLESMLHSMILEPHKKEYVRGLPNRLKRKEWAAMEEKAAKQGKILVTEGEYDEAQELAAIALDTCKLLRESIKKENFVAEASVFAYLDELKLAVKCRPDGLLMPTKEGEQGIYCQDLWCVLGISG